MRVLRQVESGGPAHRTTSDGEGGDAFYRSQQETLDVLEEGIELSSAPVAGAGDARRGKGGLMRRDTDNEDGVEGGRPPLAVRHPLLSACLIAVPPRDNGTAGALLHAPCLVVIQASS